MTFLLRSQHADGSLRENNGTMYSHGFAALALCEAYGLSRDQGLKQPAQRALDYIVQCQDPNGGGWRCKPRQPGDTSITGWQVSALAAGQLANLDVPTATLSLAGTFLDLKQSGEGAFYGYENRARHPSTSAIGLLCRIHLGWKHDVPALKQGVAYLLESGPTAEDIYFNYYATQVLRDYGGESWTGWNTKLRTMLTKSQSDKGHEAGSWYFAGDKWVKQGGRLYCTAMSALILETYYRYPRHFDDAAP